MSPIKHSMASGAISISFAYVTGSLGGAVICFLSGILIDLDHVLDFWIAKKRPPLRYHDLHSFCDREKTGNIYLALHSYELHGVFWLVILSLNLNVFWVGLAVGMTTHLLFDQALNQCVRPLTYFACYRMQMGFSKEHVFRDKHYKTLV